MTIQPARYECHACGLLRAGFLAFQPVVDNACGTRVEQVVSSFQKILRGSQLTWCFPAYKTPPQIRRTRILKVNILKKTFVPSYETHPKVSQKSRIENAQKATIIENNLENTLIIMYSMLCRY